MSGKKPGSSRRRAREVALQVLYAVDLMTARPRPPEDSQPVDRLRPSRGPLPSPSPVPGPDQVFEAIAGNFEMPDGAREFARELVGQVRDHIEVLDNTIGTHASNWRVARMAVVDRNILRIGTYELSHTETPGAVILNEAVDLARRFGSDPSPAFVNGILDAVARGVRELEA